MRVLVAEDGAKLAALVQRALRRIPGMLGSSLGFLIHPGGIDDRHN